MGTTYDDDTTYDETPYDEMTTEHLGSDATEADLAEFIGFCELYQERTGCSNQEATDAVWGNGDYRRNARELGLIIPTIAYDTLTSAELLAPYVMDGEYWHPPLDIALEKAREFITHGCMLDYFFEYGGNPWEGPGFDDDGDPIDIELWGPRQPNS